MKVLLSLLLLSASLAFATTVADARSAADIVYTQLLRENITGRSILILEEQVSAGTVMGSWRYEVTAPVSGYLVLVDDMAYANWEHPCRWVFVTQNGEMEVVHMTTPPDALDEMQVTHTCLPKTENRGQYEDFLAWFTPNVQSTSGNADHMYALIISGGYNSGNNHIRYYGDVQFIYNVLTYDYLLEDDHIIVCFSDGLNPAPDQSGGLNSNPDFDDDGDSDIIYDATSAGVDNAFSDLASLVGSDDHLFVFTTDHGGSGKFSNSPPEVYLNLWNTQTLDDDVWQTKLAGLTYSSCHVVMEQCYSGGMLEETIAGTTGYPSSFASAANGSESSWAGATYPEYDEYVYYWTGAMHGSIPPTSSLPGGSLPGDPDVNGDGCVSFYEAFDRAKAWDTYAQSGQEHPQWDDDPDSCGDTYYLGGLIQTGVGSGPDEALAPLGGFRLSENPLASMTSVTFSLNQPSEVSIRVFDMSGRVVQELLSDHVGSGEHAVAWNTDALASGVYVVRLRTADFAQTLSAVKF